MCYLIVQTQDMLFPSRPQSQNAFNQQFSLATKAADKIPSPNPEKGLERESWFLGVILLYSFWASGGAVP